MLKNTRWRVNKNVCLSKSKTTWMLFKTSTKRATPTRAVNNSGSIKRTPLKDRNFENSEETRMLALMSLKEYVIESMEIRYYAQSTGSQSVRPSALVRPRGCLGAPCGNPQIDQPPSIHSCLSRKYPKCVYSAPTIFCRSSSAPRLQKVWEPLL